jgi:hypothetical protein
MRQRSRPAIFAGLVLGLLSSGLAAAHGAGGGNGSAGHGAAHGAGHARGHHRAGWRGERGSGHRDGAGHGGWSIPGYGFYFLSIPAYCQLVYWDGEPYYYADDVYYEWNSSVGAYEQVQPPAGLAENTQTRGLRELFVFPNGDQTIEQLERDREDCQRWAADQVGLDPNVAANRAAYLRADQACLEARDYSVE